ncbi:MAG: DUF3365 domain-containing protein [Pseudomonadota bacterium]
MTTLRYTLAGIFTLVAIWLFATAPPDLPDEAVGVASARALEVEKMFNSVNAINDAARTIYTGRIVGPGLKSGLKFGEDWNEPGIDKGPLPALFLRLAAAKIEAKPPQLGLYLGSDAPINASNLFSNEQAVAFEEVKATEGPVFSTAEGVGFVAMYPDFAGAQPCVTCHNEHADSPKTDWELGDVMGATTWTFPRSTLGPDDYLTTTDAFMTAVAEAYSDYLTKVQGFAEPVEIGPGWPEPGKLIVPDLETFMAEVRAAAAETVLNELVLTAMVVPEAAQE